MKENLLFSWVFIFLLACLAGRFAAVLAEIVQDESGQIKVPVWPSFLSCQKKWGWLPFLSIFRSNWPSYLRPFIVEVLMLILFLALFYFIGWKYVLIEYLLFIFGVVTASAIDLERMILPDFLTLSGIIIGLLGAILNPDPARAFLPAIMGVLIGGGFLWMIAICYYALRKEDGIGGGDIKLLAWIGSVLTWKAVPLVILLACVLALCASFVSWIYVRQNWLQRGIPFGPYLSAAAILYIFFGKSLAHWYLSYFLHPLLVMS